MAGNQLLFCRRHCYIATLETKARTIKLTFQTYDKKELGQPKLKFTQLQHFFQLTSVYLHGWVKSGRGIQTEVSDKCFGAN